MKVKRKIFKILILIIIPTNSIGQIKNEKFVYINGYEIKKDFANCTTNIFITDKIIEKKEIKNGIGFFIEYNLNKNKLKYNSNILDVALLKCADLTTKQFVKIYKKEIIEVIYYLEDIDHGDLVELYGRDAYNLLDLDILKPEINKIKRKLITKGMKLIDDKANLKEDRLRQFEPQ